MVTKPSYTRLGAFAAVLLLSSGLLVTLFEEAGAASIHVDEIGTVSGGTHSFLVNIEIPDGQVMPIEAVSAVIEENPQGLDEKQAGIESPLVERADCKTPFPGCPEPEDMEKTGDHPNAVVGSIEFKGFFRDQVATGYEINTGYLSTDAVDFTFDGGYGYDSTVGYGYGGIVSEGPVGDGYGGYGYDGAALFVQFEVTIRPSVLAGAFGTGNYWFTFLADHGIQSVNQQLNSPAQSFTVIRPGSGPAPTPSGDGGGSAPTGPVSVDGQPFDFPTPDGMSPPIGAWRATITGDAGQNIIINTQSDLVPSITFTLDSSVQDADVQIVVWPADQNPEGTPGLPSGTTGAFFLQVTISSGGTDHSISVEVVIPADDVENPAQAFVMKHENPWNPLATLPLALDGENYHGTFTASCCSSYAVAFDNEDPTVILTASESEVSPGDRVTFTAEAEDNVLMDRVEFYRNGELVETATSQPYTWEWVATGPGEEHTIEAVAYDLVGNSASDSQSVNVERPADPPAQVPWAIIVAVLAVLLIAGAAYWYFTREKTTTN